MTLNMKMKLAGVLLSEDADICGDSSLWPSSSVVGLAELLAELLRAERRVEFPVVPSRSV